MAYPLGLLLWETFYYSFIALILAALYWVWYIPMDRIRTVNDVGFSHLNHLGRRKKLWINRMRKSRQNGKAPPVYPNGWFVVAESKDVLPGSLHQVNAMGLELCVFRGEQSGNS